MGGMTLQTFQIRMCPVDGQIAQSSPIPRFLDPRAQMAQWIENQYYLTTVHCKAAWTPRSLFAYNGSC